MQYHVCYFTTICVASVGTEIVKPAIFGIPKNFVMIVEKPLLHVLDTNAGKQLS
jgi:hypothetical protein